MAKVANLMANHNGNPTAVVSLYDEKISEVEIEDTDTKIFVHFDSDGSIVDECGNSWLSYQYTTGSNTGATVATVITSDNVYNGFNYGASFSGNRIYIRRESNTSALNNWCNKDYTVEFWACVDSDTFENNDTGIFYLGGSWGYSAGRAKNSSINYYYQYSKTTGVYQLKIIWGGVSARAYNVSPEILLSPFHFACVFNKSTGYASVFLNGILLGSDDSRFYDNSNFNIYSVIIGAMAAQDPYASNFFKGVISGFRYSEKLLYTKTFTPQNPISLSLKNALPVKGNLCVQALTPYAQNTKILMHFDDPDNPFKDECNFYPMYKVAGTTSLTETNAQFGTALNFDGATYFRTNGKVSFGGKDFTIDCWAAPRIANYAGAAPIWQLANSASQRIQVAIQARNSEALNWYYNWGGAVGGTAFSFQADNLVHHFAVSYVHETGTWYAFVDGILQGTSTWQISRLSAYLFLGYNNQGYVKLVGQICEFRFIDGVALWTEDFTPPDKPYALVKTLYAPLIMQNSPAVDDKTVSLLHFEDPDNPYKDECGNIWNRAADQAGVVIDTSTAVFGSGCLRPIQKSPQSVPYTLNPVYLGGRDFTIDFWFKGEICFWVSSNNNDSVPRVVIYGGKILYNTTQVASFSVTATAKNSWRHFALVYNYASNIGTCYINGSRVVAKTFSPRLERQACRTFPYCGPSSSYPPRFDEFRVVDGLQVWTSNFTPPTEPYSLETFNGKFPPCIGVRKQGNNFYTVR